MQLPLGASSSRYHGRLAFGRPHDKADLVTLTACPSTTGPTVQGGATNSQKLDSRVLHGVSTEGYGGLTWRDSKDQECSEAGVG